MGIPGCGKTTFGASLGNSVVVCSSDKYVEAHATSARSTYNKVFKEVIGTADKLFKQDVAFAIQNGKSIYLDRTNLSRKALEFTTIFEGYIKIGLIFPQHSWEKMEEINKERIGKEISYKLFMDFYNNWNYRFDFDRKFTEKYFDLVLEV